MSRRKARKSAYTPPAHEIVNRKERTSSARTKRPGRTHSASRADRVPEPPSWQRILRRRLPVAAIAFFVLQFMIISNVAETKGNPIDERIIAAAGPALMMALLFVPMSYFMDRSMYKAWQRRQQKVK